MPIDDKGTTPAEILYGRRIRNLIPKCNGKESGRNRFMEELRKLQIKQKQYYDRGSKKLKKLDEGQAVKIHSEDKQVPH